MNTERLSVLLDTVRAHPNQIDLQTWYSWDSPLGSLYATRGGRTVRYMAADDEIRVVTKPDAFADCNTVGCFAGWGCHIYPEAAEDACAAIVEEGDKLNFKDVAARIFDLTDDEASWLFFAPDVPSGMHRLWMMVEHGVAVVD